MLPWPQTTAAGSQPASSAFVTGKVAPVKSSLVTPDGKATYLALGEKATVVVAMATWCKYCAYMDKWVLPALATGSGVEVDVVDVSQTGGIANPGPRVPAFSGTDGSGATTLSESGMEVELRTYIIKYALAQSGINFYAAPSSTQRQWHISAFPTVVVLNSDGIVSLQQPGAMTLAELTAAVHDASSH